MVMGCKRLFSLLHFDSGRAVQADARDDRRDGGRALAGVCDLPRADGARVPRGAVAAAQDPAARLAPLIFPLYRVFSIYEEISSLLLPPLNEKDFKTETCLLTGDSGC